MIVERFLEWIDSAPVSQRVEATDALAKAYLLSEMEAEEKEAAEAAMTLLLEDPSPTVRLALAEAFDGHTDAPRHIVMMLAADTPEISEYVICHSPAFVDAELIDLVATGTSGQQIAIAQRKLITPGVVGAIVEVAREQACLELLGNEYAKCSPRLLHRLAERFGTSVQLRNGLLERNNLRADTRLLLIDKLGQSLKGFVTSKSWLSEGKAFAAVRDACDKASINFVANTSNDDLDSVVASLIEAEKVTTSFLLRAICMGNITLVARSLSQLSQTPAARVEAMMVNDRKAAFRAVFDRAGLPDKAFDVFHTAVSAWRRLLEQETEISQSRLPYLVTREVLEKYATISNPVVDDLLVLLRKLAAETARESAKAKVFEMQEKSSQRALPAAVGELAPEEQAQFMNDFSEAFEQELLLDDEESQNVAADENDAEEKSVEEIEEVRATAEDAELVEENGYLHDDDKPEPIVMDPIAPVIVDVHSGREIPLQIAA